MDKTAIMKLTKTLILALVALITMWISNKVPTLQLSGDTMYLLSGLLILGTWYFEKLMKILSGESLTEEEQEAPPIGDPIFPEMELNDTIGEIGTIESKIEELKADAEELKEEDE